MAAVADPVDAPVAGDSVGEGPWAAVDAGGEWAD